MIYDIIKSAEELRDEKALGAITPERVGQIMTETLKYINDTQLFADALVHKVYATDADFNKDQERLSDLTNKPMKAGQMIFIQQTGRFYRYDGGTSRTLVGDSLYNQVAEQLAELESKVFTHLDVGNIDPMLDENMYYFLTQSNNMVGRFSIRTIDGVLYRGVHFGGYTSGGTEKHIVGIDEYGCFVDLKTSDKGATWTSAIVNEYEKIPLKSVLAAIEQNFTEEEKEVMRTNLGVDLLLDELREEIQTELDSNNELIEDLQNTKIDKEADDYYPQLSVGMADNLAGQEDATPSEFNYRQSGGGAILDGTARIEAIKGNSLVWNQMYKPFSWLIGTTQEVNGVLFTIEDSGTISAEGTAQGDTAALTCFKYNFKASHKYILIAKGAPAGKWRELGLYFVGTSVTNASSMIQEDGYRIFQPTADGESSLTLTAWSGYSLNCSFRPIFCDLTLMFGSGNEPTTIEEFYARIPQNIDLYAYNEGEVIHSNVDAIESVGLNLWDEQWESGAYDNGVKINTTTRIRCKNPITCFPSTAYRETTIGEKSNTTFEIHFLDDNGNYISKTNVTNNTFTTPDNCYSFVFCSATNYYGGIYNHDICINISDTAKNGTYEPYISREQRLDIIKKYFPNGMRSAGTAHDEIRWNKQTQKWEAVQNIGSVDMGTLGWFIETSNTNVCYGAVAKDLGAKPASGWASKPNVLCSKYIAATPNEAAGKSTILDVVSITPSSGVYVCPSVTYATGEFKAAMQGVMLYFELATPIVTEIDEDINLDYEVWNGGTEKAISTEPTTPFKADIVYGFNAYGVIKDLRTQIATLQTMLSQMQVAMASIQTSSIASVEN